MISCELIFVSGNSTIVGEALPSPRPLEEAGTSNNNASNSNNNNTGSSQQQSPSSHYHTQSLPIQRRQAVQSSSFSHLYSRY